MSTPHGNAPQPGPSDDHGLRALEASASDASRIPPALSRADLHVHTTASAYSKLGVQRSVGMPECATPPEEVYELAKRRGMDFVAVTDHDTIAGALQIADRPDVIVGEELTAWFKGEPCAVHVLCLGITQDDHDWLQAHNHDVVRCAEYLHGREITTALAHPFYYVEAPLTARHRRLLAELFPIWEVRNGSRARELNAPAATYIDTHGGVGIGGTDDHAGVDIGRTYTETPLAYGPAEYLAHIRAGRCVARGIQGGAAKWSHAAMGIAIRALGLGEGGEPVARPRPEAMLKIVSRVMSEGDVRRGEQEQQRDIGPEDARSMLRAWLDGVGLQHLGADELLAMFQEEGFDHADLQRRATRAHERKLVTAVEGLLDAVTSLDGSEQAVAAAGERLPELGGELLDALVPVIPYAPSTAFLGRERRKLKPRMDGERPRVALIADGIGGMHGVTHTLNTIRERGVPGFDVEVIGTDHNVDRRLPAVAEVDIPFYEGLRLGVPSVPALVEELSEGRYDVVHLCSPGPAGVVGLGLAKLLELPLLGSYHTELATYTGLRSADRHLEQWATLALGAFYGQADVVVTPSPQSDEAVRALGIAEDRIGRWDRGVDVERFSPARRDRRRLAIAAGHEVADAGDDHVYVLYAGRLTKEKGVDLLAEAFLAARRRDPRLHLVLAGGGPEEEQLRARLGGHATFLGWLSGDDLADAYASADLFLFASRTDTFGQVLLEAQASGLPVVAVDEGGPRSLVADGVSGFLRPAAADALAEALLALSADRRLRERLAAGGLAAVADRTWDAALGRLAAGYRRALAAGTLRAARRDAEAAAARELVRPAGERRVA